MTFLKKIHLHPILLLFIFLSIITGTFIHLFILFSIVLIHEAGHYMVARYFGWEIHSIVLWVFGGVMKTDETMNRPIKEEILVTIAGPVQHVFIFLMLLGASYMPFVADDIIVSAHYYNVILLVFNLLPIFPLDGGKLLLSCLSSAIPFKKAHDWTILFSIFACLAILLYQIILYPFTLSAFMLFLFLLWENYQEWKYRTYLLLRFLLNREDYPQHSTIQVPGYYQLMDVFYLFRRNYRHTVYIESTDRHVDEKSCIDMYVNEGRIHDSLDDIWGKYV